MFWKNKNNSFNYFLLFSITRVMEYHFKYIDQKSYTDVFVRYIRLCIRLEYSIFVFKMYGTHVQ